VCPLYFALPRLVLSITYTCGCFDSAWVRRQWDRIDMLWIEDCLDSIGPILGHASDGNSRRRQLMLADYLSDAGKRYRILWDGWLMSACIDLEGRVFGLHDEDYVYNGKKLINPLDSPVRSVLQLGGDICCLEHVSLIYVKFQLDEHGLYKEDYTRKDKQNWASIQRLCQKKPEIV
jgi:hypothetical protein